MPKLATMKAWNFDPAFQAGPVAYPPGWNGEPTSTFDANTESGRSIDIDAYIVSVTVIDANSDSFITGDTDFPPDVFIINGIEHEISGVFNGDKATISGVEYLLVTIYGYDESFNEAVICVPVIDGSLGEAFAGTLSATKWRYFQNKFPLIVNDASGFTLDAPVNECYILGTIKITTAPRSRTCGLA